MEAREAIAAPRTCSTCGHWKRGKWDKDYVKRYGPATFGECAIRSRAASFSEWSMSATNENAWCPSHKQKL